MGGHLRRWDAAAVHTPSLHVFVPLFLLCHIVAPAIRVALPLAHSALPPAYRAAPSAGHTPPRSGPATHEDAWASSLNELLEKVV